MNNDPNEFPSYNEPLPLSPYQQSALNTASAIPQGPPQVIGWYKAYAGFMAFVYFLVMVGGFIMIKYANELSDLKHSPAEMKVQGLIFAILGITLFIAFVVALVLPKSPGAWVYHIVMIGIGLTSCCLWLATIPLMIAWIKPETQQFFGRFDAFTPRRNDPNWPQPPIPRA